MSHRIFSADTHAKLVLCLLALTATQAYAARINTNPYANVDWQNDFRLKTQFHDHVATIPSRYEAYDAAGYDAVGMLYYSGDPSLQIAWTERRWPPEDWLPASLLDNFENIQFLFPSTEERYPNVPHLTSPFLTTYIEHWDPTLEPEKLPYHHSNAQEAINMIGAFGGIPFLAHPWNNCCDTLTGYHAAEIYNAYATGKHALGEIADDRNTDMMTFWDTKLIENPTLYGISVNDWFGPWRSDIPDWVSDSGKTIVLADEANMDSLRRAVEAGAMLAVKDFGVVKDQFPLIESISLLGDTIMINSTDSTFTTTWISNGSIVGSGPSFDTATLSPDARYLRAELINAEGSTVYTQPWGIRIPEPNMIILVSVGTVLLMRSGRG